MRNVILNQNKNEILNIIEALQLYKDIAVKPKNKNIIDDQLENIGKQLKEQNIEIIIHKEEAKFNIGKKILYDNNEAIVIGNSNENEFIKVVIYENNKLNIIDVPIALLEEIKE